MNKLIASAFVLVAFSANSFGQNLASATASATIVTPITITKDFDMDFGGIAVGLVGGDVVLDPSGSRSTTDPTIHPVTTQPGIAAQFTVTGQAGFAYTITLPGGGLILMHTDLINAMSAGAFTDAVVSGGTLETIEGTGDQVFSVGATLTLAGGQAPGLYTSVPFDVTVSYN